MGTPKLHRHQKEKSLYWLFQEQEKADSEKNELKKQLDDQMLSMQEALKKMQQVGGTRVPAHTSTHAHSYQRTQVHTHTHCS